MRVDPIEYFSEIGPAQQFVFRDQTHAVGPQHSQERSAGACVAHWRGGVTILSAVAIGWAISRYGYDAVLAGSWLTMRWLTGLGGSCGGCDVVSAAKAGLSTARGRVALLDAGHLLVRLRVWCCCFTQAREPVDC